MHSAKEKISNMASAAKEHVDIGQAKVAEKAEKATARTPEQKEIAHEHRKTKEAEAKMELHQTKAKHAQEKSGAKYGHHHQPTVGAPANMAGTTVPTYPLGGHPPGNKYM